LTATESRGGAALTWYKSNNTSLNNGNLWGPTYAHAYYQWRKQLSGQHTAMAPALGCAGGTYSSCYWYDSDGNLTAKTDNRGL
jgi:hypothetical protein